MTCTVTVSPDSSPSVLLLELLVSAEISAINANAPRMPTAMIRLGGHLDGPCGGGGCHPACPCGGGGGCGRPCGSCGGWSDTRSLPVFDRTPVGSTA
jgi:hypothetical protein